MLSGTVAILVLRLTLPARVILLCTVLMPLGIVALIVGIADSGLAVLSIGLVVAGFGVGAGFCGAMCTLLPCAGAHERAELLAVFFIVAYLAMSLPAIGAGYLSDLIGLSATAEVFGSVVILLTVFGYFLLRTNDVFSEETLTTPGE